MVLYIRVSVCVFLRVTMSVIVVLLLLLVVVVVLC